MRERISDSDKGQIRSVSRAAQILKFIALEPTGRTAKEIASGAGMPLATAYHLLGTLVAEGLLTKSGSRRYLLGHKVGFLGDAFRSQFALPQDLVERVHELAARTAETAYLSGWRNGEAVVVSIVEGRQAVRVAGIHLGFSGGSHMRASGKVLLAFSSPETLEAYVRAHAVGAGTGDSDGPTERLRAELELVRARGYAVDEEAFAEGVGCIAAPVADGSIAIGISAPIERYRRNHASLLDAVRSVCDATVTPLRRTAEAS
jgi:IclR family acetate operon transcriptional repressor